MKNKYNIIIDLIHNADFYEAQRYFKQFDESQQRDIIISEAASTDNISVLGFVNFLISQNNCYFNHQLAAEAYIQMCFIEGAYNIALFHAWEMHRINPGVDEKKFLLFFYAIPERLLPLEIAKQIAGEIINIDTDYKPALEILSLTVM